VDPIHPTTRVHQIIGQSVVTYVTTGRNVEVIPEPSTVLLFGAGALTLAGVAARRRARAA
jgi:phospholipase/lecithinase/hemolysin